MIDWSKIKKALKLWMINTVILYKTLVNPDDGWQIYRELMRTGQALFDLAVVLLCTIIAIAIWPFSPLLAAFYILKNWKKIKP